MEEISATLVIFLLRINQNENSYFSQTAIVSSVLFKVYGQTAEKNRLPIESQPPVYYAYLSPTSSVILTLAIMYHL